MENITKSRQLSARITGLGWVTAAEWGRGRSGGVLLWETGDPQPPTSILQNLHGGSRFGRLDLFSQIGVAAVALALFLVLEKEQDRRAPFCGIVSCNLKKNGFCYNDQACTDILSLIKM